MVILSMTGAAAPIDTTEVASETDTTDGTVQTLEHGEDLYFVFGAELENRSADEFIESQLADRPESITDQEEIADVVQYQDVEQVDFNRQGGAISIAIDGGEATAIQEANQQNANSQVGEATAENTLAMPEDVAFENVGNVHIVFGTGDNQTFDGWSVADGTGDEPTQDVTQPTEASTDQEQDVDQVNFNDQSAAFAIAENASEAVAYQRSTQANQNLQHGSTELFETAVSDPATTQSSLASIDQSQNVSQANHNQQGLAVAIAVGPDSVATAIQITDQTNLNEQVASTEIVSVLDVMSGMNVATADVDNSSVLSTTGGDGGDTDDADATEAAVSVTQYQSAEQVNVNLQSAAVAIAVNESNATAIQLAEQRNYNEQVGVMDAETTEPLIDPLLEAAAGAVITNETTVTIGGNEIDGEPLLALEYDGESGQQTDGEQYSAAALDQIQFVNQLNVNQQQAALAIAQDNGSADASQITIQENRNVQFSDVESTAVGSPPADGTDSNGTDGTDGDGTDGTEDGSTGADNDDGDKPTEGTGEKAKNGAGDKPTDGDKDAKEKTDGGTDDTTPSDSDGDTDTTGDTTPADSDDEDEDDSMPGLGVGVALLALLVASLFAARDGH
ncbi:PGF-CTERM protein [Natronorubrum thiooxidans]|uniref:PGF-CTERM protein n=2 Tax=Natronorubrum thiooxidans TaxID=308853 RepID=A0A1N7FSR6_9EURY|nr:PGF-CTERM protein [Natronorubrum thiooxidans]